MSKHGLLLINKPKGITSHDVVARVRRALGTREVGHTGTLDPLATGLMVTLLGDATKLSDYFLAGDKGYIVKVRLGLETDSYDVTGTVLRQCEVDVDPNLVRENAIALQGEFQWPVPVFSAVKKDGKKLYESARAGEAVICPVKEMRFWGVEVIEADHSSAVIKMMCSKGSFIRSWVHELGTRLGCGATVEELKRTDSAPFSLQRALDLEAFEGEAMKGPVAWGASFIPMREALPEVPALTVRGRDERLLQNGQIAHDLERRMMPNMRKAIATGHSQPIRILSGENGEMLALVEAIPGAGIKIRRVFKTS